MILIKIQHFIPRNRDTVFMLSLIYLPLIMCCPWSSRIRSFFFPPHIWNASKLKLSLESCSVQWRWDPFINKKMFGILNKDSWYLAGFVIYRLSFWLITTLTVSMETKKNYFCLQGTHAKMRNILPLWRIHTHIALLVNFVLLSILPREKAKPVGGYQRL